MGNPWYDPFGLDQSLYKSFNPDDPTKQAQKYMGQIPGTVKPYYDPYIEAGGKSREQLMDEYQQLMENPDEVYNRIGKGYQQSPGYQFQLQQALSAGNNAAAAGGMIGSPAHEQNQMAVAQGLAAQDYDKYFENAMGLYGKGLGGYGDINKMGYESSDELAKILGNNIQNQASLSYKGAAEQNAGRGAFWGNAIKLAGLL